MDQSQKLINPFVSETKESACIYICITVVIDIIMATQQIILILHAYTHTHTHNIYIYIHIYIYIYIYIRGGDGTSATRAWHDQ